MSIYKNKYLFRILLIQATKRLEASQGGDGKHCYCCQKQMEIDQATERLLHDDQSSINSNGPHHRRQSLSSTSFCSSRKEKLRVVLIARKKLELAKTRAN